MADELSSDTWDLLNGPGEGHGDRGLGMLLKMTRLEDLGLGQLCFPDIDFDSGDDSDPSQPHSYLLKHEREDPGDVVIGPLESYTDSVYSVPISNDGKHIAPGSHDHTIHLWDAKTTDVVGWENSMQLARPYTS